MFLGTGELQVDCYAARNKNRSLLNSGTSTRISVRDSTDADVNGLDIRQRQVEQVGHQNRPIISCCLFILPKVKKSVSKGLLTAEE